MELKLENGDYVPDGVGGLRHAEGREALIQRVLFKLTARRGSFPFQEHLGSRLWTLGRISPGARQSAAEQFAAEALADEPGLRVESVTLSAGGNGVIGVEVRAFLEEEPLAFTVEVR